MDRMEAATRIVEAYVSKAAREGVNLQDEDGAKLAELFSKVYDGVVKAVASH